MNPTRLRTPRPWQGTVSAHETLDKLAQDRERGASEITNRALRAYHALAQDATDPLDAVATAGAKLIHAHPAMAPLVTATSRTLDALQTEGPNGIQRVQHERRERQRRTRDNAAERIHDARVVATYSRSSTVLSALRKAHDEGARFRVILSEARPNNESLPLTRELAQHEIHVTLTYDAALPNLAQDADTLLLGADTLCQKGLINKTGTHPLARTAKQANVTTLATATTDKFLPPTYRKRPPLTTTGTLGHTLPGNAKQAAPLFECTPVGLFDAIITEHGPTKPDDLDNLLSSAPFSPILARRLKRASL